MSKERTVPVKWNGFYLTLAGIHSVNKFLPLWFCVFQGKWTQWLPPQHPSHLSRMVGRTWELGRPTDWWGPWKSIPSICRTTTCIFRYGLASCELGEGKSFLTMHEVTEEMTLKIYTAEDQTQRTMKTSQREQCPLKSKLKWSSSLIHFSKRE